VLEHHVPDLGAVPVADDDVITPPDERHDLSARVLYVLELFLVSAFLVAFEQRVPTEGEDG
jgi:hypothetical protein